MNAPSDPLVIHRSDLLTWGKVVAIVLTLIGATWKLSGDASDVRNSVTVVQRDALEMRARLTRHDELIEAISKQLPTAKQMDLLDARVAAVIAANATLTAGQAAAESRAAQFFGQTWPAINERLKRIEDLLDGRKRP